jgi:hypothetical protein
VKQRPGHTGFTIGPFRLGQAQGKAGNPKHVIQVMGRIAGEGLRRQMRPQAGE